mmetsp:Transcript_43485/g.69576  ORF Transcript_43485/g.69576 Transcript_43485/m.69576 type:complete len:281 (+) Transcript_43485:136-978(+)
MHFVSENGEQVILHQCKIHLRPGSVRCLDDYFVMLEGLSDPEAAGTGIQFTSIVGLGRAALTGCGLGGIFAAHFLWFCMNILHDDGSIKCMWSLYMCALCFYHMSEFVVTMRYNSSIASCKSFLLDQSREYQIAMVASWLEFWLQAFLFPWLKVSFLSKCIVVLGVCIMFVGQYFRTGAMICAGSNFSHIIQFRKADKHQLVTTGLYSVSRHPSYFGWFWWSIGTQLLLCNPICTVGFAAAAYKFFSDRIPVEEKALVKFFPTEYPAYRARTPVGIPFIS